MAHETFNEGVKAMLDQSLVAEVIACCGDVSYAGEVAYSSECRHDECNYLRERFAGKRRAWQPDVLDLTRYDVLGFFSREALAFFLPQLALDALLATELEAISSFEHGLPRHLLMFLRHEAVGSPSSAACLIRHDDPARAVVCRLLGLIDERVGYSAELGDFAWLAAFCGGKRDE